MKKVFICILVTLICFSIFSACGDSQQTISQQTSIQQTTNTEQKTVMNLSPPTNRYIYKFDLFDDIVHALTMKDTEEFEALRVEQDKWGKVYIDTLSAFASREIKVAIPQLDGNNIGLRNRAGNSNISFFTHELYYLPWIWYNCVVDGYNLRVCVAYPGVLGSAEIDSATSYLEVLSLLSLEAPTPDNFHEFEEYKNIYEKEIVLADGRKVMAMISELNDISNEYVMYYQDGMLIILYGDSQLFTDEFWSLFSMAQY